MQLKRVTCWNHYVTALPDAMEPIRDPIGWRCAGCGLVKSFDQEAPALSSPETFRYRAEVMADTALEHRCA